MKNDWLNFSKGGSFIEFHCFHVNQIKITFLENSKSAGHEILTSIEVEEGKRIGGLMILGSLPEGRSIVSISKESLIIDRFGSFVKRIV